MRVIAGKYRGRVIEAPKGDDTRPTTDRVRESVMSSVYSHFGGFDRLHILDAFSGSGALGIEALSRGAATCVFNDTAKEARKALRSNLGCLGIGDDMARISDVDIMRSGLPGQSAQFMPYDLVFYDPPYRLSPQSALDVFSRASSRGRLAKEALVVYESSVKIEEDLAKGLGLGVAAVKKYGKTYIAYLTLDQ